MLRRMTTPDEQQQLQRAASLRQAGRLDEAAALCERVAGGNPDAVDALQLLGLIRKQQGRFDDAERLLRRCVDKAPQRADFQTNLGNLLFTIGKFEAAEFVYREAIGIDAEFQPARLGLARMLTRVGYPDAAEREIRAWLAKHPTDAQALSVLGGACQAQGKSADAETAFRDALEQRPDNGVTLHNLGAVVADQYRAEEALELFERAAGAGLDGPELGANIARALLALERHDEAMARLEKTVQRFPQATDPQSLLAKLRYMEGDADFARSLRAAAEKYRDNVFLQRTFAVVLRGAGEPESAAEVLEGAIATVGAHPVLLAELAGARQDDGDYAGALEAAREACRLNPGDPSLNDRVTDALLSLGRADEALPLIRAARQRDPLYQWHIACEATAARVLGDPLYETLYDYERFVRAYELPTPPGWSSLSAFNEDLARALELRHRFRIAPLDQSLRHGTQTPISLLADPDPVIAAYREALLGPIAEFRAAIGDDPGHPFTARNRGETVLQAAWSVKLRKGGYHVNHVHPEGWISSAYYVSVPSEVDDPEKKSGWIKFGEPRYPVPGADAAHFVKPAAGLLVLFPSYLWHGTTAIHGDEPRLTAPVDVTTRPG